MTQTVHGEILQNFLDALAVATGLNQAGEPDADKPEDCVYTAHTPECLNAATPEVCARCNWWADFCKEDDDG